MSRPVAPVEELLGEQSRVEFKADNTDPGKIGIRISALSNAVRLADRQGHLLNPETVLKVRLKFESLPVKFSRGGSRGWFRFNPQCSRFPIRGAASIPHPQHPFASRRHAHPARAHRRFTERGRRDDPGHRNGALRILSEGNFGFHCTAPRSLTSA